MPTLPTFDVSAATATRIMKVFENVKDDETGETLTPQVAYKRWLKRVLMEKVTATEAQASNAALSDELK
jgi:hypothetical protein